MSSNNLRRAVAIVLALAVTSLTAYLPAAAGSAAVLRGRVVGADGTTPRPSAVVTLVDPSSERTFSSEPADARGFFRIDAAPAGSYSVVVETRDGAYLAAKALPLSAGANQPVSLALKPGAPVSAGEGTPKPSGGGGKLVPWQKWVIVGGIVVGAIVIADAVSGEEEKTASPSF